MIRGSGSIDRSGGEKSHGGENFLGGENSHRGENSHGGGSEASDSEMTGQGGMGGAAESEAEQQQSRTTRPGPPGAPVPPPRASTLNAAVPEFHPLTTTSDAPLHDHAHAHALRSSAREAAAADLAEPAENLASTVPSSQTTASRVVDTPSAITNAFRAAPPAGSFLGLISQTRNIHHAHSRPAPDLSSIGAGSVPQPARQIFEASWALNRTRSRAFPQAQGSESNAASALSFGAIARPDRGIKLPSGRVVFATPPQLPVQADAPLSTPTRRPISRQEVSANAIARRRLRTRGQSYSQPAANLFGVPRPSNRRLSFTPAKTPLRLSEPSSQDSPLDQPNDTPEQKEKIRSLMSSLAEFGDSFDSIEWPPNERQANYSESPEILTVPAQPVASYTTVGSLRPATNQQFTAPNRIQRDGTGRRATHANTQNRGHFGGRTMNQQYNPGYGSSTHPQYGAVNYSQYGSTSQQQSGSSMQSHYGSMNHLQYDSAPQPRFGLPTQSQSEVMPHPHYGIPNQSEHGVRPHSQFGPAQQYQHGHLTQYGSENRYSYGSSAQSGFGSTHNLQLGDGSSLVGLTDAEKRVLQANGLSEHLVGSSAPSMRSGNISRQNRNMMPRIDPLLNPQAESFNLQDRPMSRAPGQTESISNSLTYIEIAENLPQHIDPTQQLARNHFSHSSATNSHHVAVSTGTHRSQQSVMTVATSYGQVVGGDNNQGNTSYDSQGRGDLDQNYRFPPPGLVHPSQADRSGAGYGQQMVSGLGSNEQVATNHRTGRPQPLSAGPPGQRQNVSAFPGNPSAQGTQSGITPLSNVQHPPVLPFNSPWLPQSGNNMFTSVHVEHSILRDTVPPAEVRQYYPNGLPNDMTGQYTRPPGTVNEGLSEEEKTNRWFHSGLRNLDMTANDYIAEMDRRNRRLDNGPNAQLPDALDECGNPLTLRGLTELSEPLTVRQVIAMDTTEVSARLLGPVFGTTLGIADQRPGPNNLAMLSRYAPGAPWTIDDTPQGNQSFFGEDWGPTPRRVGRDPRYQAFD